MGREVCRAVLAEEDLDLVAAVDTGFDGFDLGELVGAPSGGLVVTGKLDVLASTAPEVAVDFTRVDAARPTLDFCADRGIHAVVGTTGFGPKDIDHLASRFGGPSSGAPNCVLAPNFAIGAVLMMRFAELASPWFDGAEIIELHHEGKLDAPSGTSLRTAERMAAARTTAGSEPYPPDRMTTTPLPDARGAIASGVRLHSVRLPGLVAHQEVILGSAGQSLTIRHDSYDRMSFMDGVILAVRQVPTRPGLTLGIEPLLGL